MRRRSVDTTSTTRRRRGGDAASPSSRGGRTERVGTATRKRRGQGNAAMRGEEDNGQQTRRKRVLARGVLSADDAKAMVKKMRETSGADYYDVTRLEDPNIMIVFDIPEEASESQGSDGHTYTNLVPKKIVEVDMESGDVINVFHDTSLKCPTMVSYAIWGCDVRGKERDPQVDEEHIFMSYTNWEDFKKFNRGYNKVTWASEAAGGVMERIYNSAD